MQPGQEILTRPSRPRPARLFKFSKLHGHPLTASRPRRGSLRWTQRSTLQVGNTTPLGEGVDKQEAVGLARALLDGPQLL